MTPGRRWKELPAHLSYLIDVYFYSFSNSLSKQCAYRLHVRKTISGQTTDRRICYSTARSVRSAVKKEMLMQPSICYNWPICVTKTKEIFESWHITGIVFLNPNHYRGQDFIKQRHKHGSLNSTLHRLS